MTTEVLEAQLNPQQELFCRQYVKHFNAGKAAVEAGYSAKTARGIGSALLTKVAVQKRIRALVAGRLKRIELDGDQILHELKALGFFDPIAIYDEDGKMKPIHEWPPSIRKCVQSIESFEHYMPFTKELIGVTWKVKFWDKLKALELLGKNKQLFNEHIEHHHEVKIVAVDLEQLRQINKELEDEF